jgi:anti-anti-sigma factor
MYESHDFGSRTPRGVITVSAVYDFDFASTYRPADCQRWSLGRIEVVSAPAEVDIANVHLLRRALLAASIDARTVVVDMSATRFCDATTVDVIMPIGARMKEEGRDLWLVCATPGVRRVLDVLKVEDHFPIFTSLRDVLASDARCAPRERHAA